MHTFEEFVLTLVDEQLLAFCGQRPFRQFVPAEPSHYGTKMRGVKIAWTFTMPFGCEVVMTDESRYTFQKGCQKNNM